MENMNTTKISPPADENRSRWGFLFLLVLFLVYAANAVAGVLVAPTVVFLSDRNRTGRMDVQNPTNAPKEVSIHFSYGLPVSDSLGNVYVTLQDSGVTDTRSSVEWIKAFPRKLIIPPNGTQVVRLVANPPKGLADGEYWARIVIRSQEGQTSLPIPSDSTAISTKLNMIMQTAIMVKYRTGALVSKLELTKAEARMGDSAVTVIADFSNKGNVSYVGMLNCRLLDADKKEVARQSSDLAVYRDLKRRVEIPTKNLAGKRPYQVELTVSTDGRTDIAPADVVTGNKILFTMSVE
jgi:P pilus assembly chaperone PapD